MAERFLTCAGPSPQEQLTPLYGVAFWLGLASLLLAVMAMVTLCLLPVVPLVGCVAGPTAVLVTRGASTAGRVGLAVNALALSVHVGATLVRT